MIYIEEKVVVIIMRDNNYNKPSIVFTLSTKTGDGYAFLNIYPSLDNVLYNWLTIGDYDQQDVNYSSKTVTDPT